MNLTRKSLLGAFALVATLSAPLAFAQQTDPAATGASAQPAASADAAAQAAPAPTTSNDASAAASGKKGWADVDLDKDGNLSKAEAAAVPSLGQVFDKADSNGDGSLTAAEYKAYVKSSKK